MSLNNQKIYNKSIYTHVISGGHCISIIHSTNSILSALVVQVRLMVIQVTLWDVQYIPF